jgi:hypothetical protein
MYVGGKKNKVLKLIGGREKFLATHMLDSSWIEAN